MPVYLDPKIVRSISPACTLFGSRSFARVAACIALLSLMPNGLLAPEVERLHIIAGGFALQWLLQQCFMAAISLRPPEHGQQAQ